MRRSSTLFLAYAAVVACLSCSGKSRLLPDLPCFDAEKLRAEPLVFGALSEDASVPGGWSGMEVIFGADSAGRPTASIREARNDPRQTRPVERVFYDAKHDSLSFTYNAPGHTKFTRTFRPACDRLVGSATYFRARDDTSGIAIADTLPRVESR